uniref:Uncharacterized protein n=1 Tax=Salix viminalis TaxID=40686 RepID=A0A6N2MG81_SALVM
MATVAAAILLILTFIQTMSSVKSKVPKKFIIATVPLLQEPVEKELQEIHPGCIVADMLFPWAADFAAKLGIPRIVLFHGIKCVRLYEPHKKVSQHFVLPDFPGEEAEEIRSRAKNLREIAREAVEEEELRRRHEIL